MRKCFTINCMRKEEDFDGYEKLIDDNIYQGVELFYPYNVSNEQGILYTKRCLKLFNEKNIEFVLHLPHGYNNDLINENNEINEDVMKRMKDAISYASMFGCKKCTLHLGKYYKNTKREKAVEAVLVPLVILCEFAEKYGINIMIENMPSDHELGYSPSEILYLIEKSKMNNLKFILDTGHAHCSKFSYEEYIDLLKDYLYHMHFSDNNGLSDQHKKMGLGTIDFDKLFVKLNEVGYNQLHCMEIIFKDYTQLITFASDIDNYDKYYK